MVVDRHAAAGLRGGLGDRPDSRGGMLHLGRLVKFCRHPAHVHPKRWLQSPLLKALQQLREVRGRAPEGVKRDPVLGERVPLLLERGHMFAPPVVSKVLQAELLHHRRPLLGAPLLRVERDDAPGDEVVALKEFLRAGSDVDGLGGSGLRRHDRRSAENRSRDREGKQM